MKKTPTDILLHSKPVVAEEDCGDTFSTEQLMDQELKPIILYIAKRYQKMLS